MLLVIALTFVLLLSVLSTRVFAEDYDLAAVGDVSCGTEGKKTLNAIGKTNPDFALFLGDFSYKKNSVKCFIDATKSAGIKTVGCVIGNNDDRSSSATKAALKFCNLPNSGYKSLKFKGDLYIFMNSENSFKKDSSQYKFVLSALKSDTAKNARFIIVIFSKPNMGLNELKLPGQQYSMVLIDYTSQVKNSTRDFPKQVKEINDQIKIILISGFRFNESYVLREGYDQFLILPVTMSKLVTTIREKLATERISPMFSQSKSN